MHHVHLERLTAPVATVLASLSAATTDIQVPWQVFTFIATTAIAIYTWLAKRQHADRSTLTQLREDAAVVSERLRHMPTHAEVGQLNRAMGEVGADLRGLARELSTLNRRMFLVEEYLKRPPERSSVVPNTERAEA